MKTLIRYAGGKTKAIKKIAHYMYEEEEIISPFIGGGSLEVHWAARGINVRGYDIMDHLVIYWQSLLENRDLLADEMAKLKPTKEEYDRVKEALISSPYTQTMLENWKTDHYRRDPVSLDPFVEAAYYYFNHNLSYGPGFLGWPSKVYLQDSKWDKMIEKTRSFDLPTLSVENKDFAQVIKDNPNSTLYLDPPYYLDKDRDNKMFKGIYPMRNIPVHHDAFDHDLLRDLLLNHKGKILLSYNNCDTIREFYKDFTQEFPEWQYTMGQGETRIGKNRVENNIDHIKESHEILIKNF